MGKLEREKFSVGTVYLFRVWEGMKNGFLWAWSNVGGVPDPHLQYYTGISRNKKKPSHTRLLIAWCFGDTFW